MGAEATDSMRAGPRVLVIVEALIDIVEDHGQSTEHVGGSPANVALGLGRRGIDVSLLSQLGDDERGRLIVEHLEASDVTVLPESLSHRSTSTARARIGPDGHATYDFDIRWETIRPPTRAAPHLVHTGSLAAFLEPGAGSVRNFLRTTDASEITFDPNIRTALTGDGADIVAAYESAARLASVVKLSDEDASSLYPGQSVDRVIDLTLELGPSLVALTLGAHGARIASSEHRVTIPASPTPIVDTIGAGDTFMASLIHSVLKNGSRSLERATIERFGREAARAAAITVGRAGANLPWEAEL